MSKPVRWVCDDCAYEYVDDTGHVTEVVHKCKNGRRNVECRKAEE